MATKQELEARVAELEAQVADLQSQLAGGFERGVNAGVTAVNKTLTDRELFRGSLKEAAEIHHKRRESPEDRLTVIYDVPA
jgi:hypothetical protein